MRVYFLVLCLSVILFTNKAFSDERKKQVINVLTSNTNQQNSIDYFQQILMASLNATKDKYGPYKLNEQNLPYSQQRSLEFLNDVNGLDVMHTMTNQEREQKYIAIKVPLLKGLMGYRMLLTNKENHLKLSKVSNVEELRNFIACQGTHWPDSDILEHNQLIVARVLIFEAMFDMVARGRCDYFPRGIQEIFSKYQSFSSKHTNLTIVKNVMLKYRAPMYFFVGKRNRELAKRIEEGLTILINNGEFDALLKASPMASEVFPLSKWQDTKVLSLENPTIYTDEKAEFWFQLGSHAKRSMN